MAERGALALDDPVTKFLPACPASCRTITVRHLLSHASALPDYLDRPNSMDRARSEYTVRELIDAFKDRRAAMRGGASPGVCPWFPTMPDDSVAVILLGNRTPGKPRCGVLATQIAQPEVSNLVWRKAEEGFP